MKNILLLVVLSAFLWSCNPHKIYEEHQELSKNLVWEKTKKLTFEVDVTEDTIPYTISLALRYISGFPYKTLPIQLTITSPSGISTTKVYSLVVIDEKGDYIGDGAGDYWDLMQEIEKNSALEKGTYTFVAEHAMVNNPVPFVMELGLKVEKNRH